MENLNKFTEYANSFQAVARLGLENIKRLTYLLGNPQNDLKFIHVAGTNGKGSVCSVLQTALTHAGYKTGKYISPNLIDVCERISVDGVDITYNELEKIMDEIKVCAEQVYEEHGSYPTQFELWTAAAFMYFKKQHVNIVVLETGLGGEFDATNIVENTICSVITKISIDHISYLGGNIKKIAEAKAGIIKNTKGIRGITVSAMQTKEVMDVIRNKALEKENELYISSKPMSKGFSEIYEIFDCLGIENIKCGLGGMHQIENAALAAEVLNILGIDSKSIRYGIENAKNHARFELVSKNPQIIFDGAHNPDGIEALSKSIDRYFFDKKKNFIIGVMADKDLKEMIEELKKHNFNNNSKIYTVTVKDNPRAMSAGELSDVLKQDGFFAIKCDSLSEAIKFAKEDAEVVFIFGSLYLYKDFSAVKL